MLSLVVLVKELRWPLREVNHELDDNRSIPKAVVLGVAVLCGALIAIFGRLIVLSHDRYLNNVGYFIEQISSHTDYGRVLYDQIEFPYGPLLFYVPVFLRSLFSPFHVSLTGAYFTTLVLEQVVGLLIVGCIINSLPMRRAWKIVALVLCVPLALEPSFGLNYTFFRFAVAPGFLVLTAKRKRVWTTALCLFLGQVISFSVSPEIGFAFAVAGTAYAAMRLVTEGKVWVFAVATPAVATLLFLIAVGGAYLRMLKLFAHGLYNLIVEPLPNVLIFLFALVWLVPQLLASSFRGRRPEAPMLTSLYIFTLVLLPVSFGRADPGHVLFNGFVVFILSMVAISAWKPHLQVFWITGIAFVFLWTAYLDTRAFEGEFREVIHYDVIHYAPHEVRERYVNHRY